MASLQPDSELSVIVPVWGDYVGPRLDEALDSLRSQDLKARIIVVDNASEPSIGGFEGVEVIRSAKRLTVGAARNLGLESVTSPYVVFWDADDLMLPGTLRFLRDRIASEPAAVLVAASILEGDPPVQHRWPRRWAYRLAAQPRLFALAHCVWSLFPTTGSAVMRTGDVRRAHGFGDANSGEDWVLGASLAFRGRIVLEARPGRVYRQHSGSLLATQGSPAQLRASMRAVRARLAADAEIPRWVRLSAPGIALLQGIAGSLLHPLAKRVRVIRTKRRSVA